MVEWMGRTNEEGIENIKHEYMKNQWIKGQIDG